MGYFSYVVVGGVVLVLKIVLAPLPVIFVKLLCPSKT